jgi:hypothetical protein
VSPGSGVLYEAEAARVIGAMVVRPDTEDEDLDYHEGATGEAFVDFQEDSDEAIVWTVACARRGPHRLWLRYAIEDDPRPMRLVVNDKVVEERVPFVDTGDWDD